VASTSFSDALPAAVSAVRAGTREQILTATTSLFHERGFHGATMREIADRAGVESATIYYYFRGKQALLFTIMSETIADLLDSAQDALADTADPAECLRRFVANHVCFHAIRKPEAAISDSELDSLDPSFRVEIVNGRDTYELVLRRILEAGETSGAFSLPDVGMVARAILSMATGVAVWYRPEGALSPEDIGDIYADLALYMSTGLLINPAPG